MILPIVAYGDAVLKKEAEEIDQNYPDLQKLIADMFETMYHAKGVGLAAPQIGKSIKNLSRMLNYWKNIAILYYQFEMNTKNNSLSYRRNT